MNGFLDNPNWWTDVSLTTQKTCFLAWWLLTYSISLDLELLNKMRNFFFSLERRRKEKKLPIQLVVTLIELLNQMPNTNELIRADLDSIHAFLKKKWEAQFQKLVKFCRKMLEVKGFLLWRKVRSKVRSIKRRLSSIFSILPSHVLPISPSVQ